MYRWRRLTPQQRTEVLADRVRHGRPRHSVPHIVSDTTTCYLVTAACFEHQPIIGDSPERMRTFEAEFVERLNKNCRQVVAWTVLPNHYHALVDAVDIRALLRELGQLHGRSSFQWNGEANQRGRQVWCNAAETVMKSEGHYYASWNYVLHNAVHHGYVQKWTEWPYCSAEQYLAAMGREEAVRIWHSYPLYDYGKDWDPPGL
jgi:putative transposase